MTVDNSEQVNLSRHYNLWSKKKEEKLQTLKMTREGNEKRPKKDNAEK